MGFPRVQVNRIEKLLFKNVRVCVDEACIYVAVGYNETGGLQKGQQARLALTDFIYRPEITWNLKALLVFDNLQCDWKIVFLSPQSFKNT